MLLFVFILSVVVSTSEDGECMAAELPVEWYYSHDEEYRRAKHAAERTRAERELYVTISTVGLFCLFGVLCFL